MFRQIPIGRDIGKKQKLNVIDMLDIIFVNTLPDIELFRVIFNGFEDINVLENPTHDDVTELLQASTNPLMVIGHGDQNGVFETIVSDDENCTRWRGYCLDAQHADLLRQRTVIGLWCFAGEFGDRYDLHGFFTSMFISNAREAAEFCIETTDEEIEHYTFEFALQLRSFLTESIPVHEWVDRLQSNCNKNIPLVRFNYEALAYYE